MCAITSRSASSPARSRSSSSPSRTDAEDRALGDEQRDLPALAPHARAVADLLELRDELLMAAFLADDRLAVLPADVEVARGQRAAEDDALARSG